MIKARFILFVLFCLQSLYVICQDVQFTQFDVNHIFLNPSQAGNTAYKSRIGIVYRDQWRSILNDAANTTGFVAFDKSIQLNESTLFGLGGFYFIERVGELRNLNQGSSIVASIKSNIYKNHTLGFGTAIGISERRIESGFWPNGDIFPSQTKRNLKINLGILWKYKAESNFETNLGLSINHANKPNISFDEEFEINQLARLNFHGNLRIPVNKEIEIMPSFNCSNQGPHESCRYGLFGSFNFNSSKLVQSIKPGLFIGAGKQLQGKFRNNVYSFISEVRFKSFLVGISYDKYRFIESDAFELSLAYFVIGE